MINPDELLFSVDENNNPIEPQPRGVSHAKRIWHRSCHVYIVDTEKQQVLCQKRSKLKDHNAGLWEANTGGHLTAGQTYLEAAISEVSEEIGLKLDESNLKFIKEVKYEAHPEYLGIFLYKWSGDINSLVTEEEEVDELAWFPIDYVIEHILTKPDKAWSHFSYDLDFLKKI